MNIRSMVHVNVNCSDFVRSLRFYEMLGFKPVIDALEYAGPDVARALGLPPYKLRASLLALEGATTSTLIDLIEWKEPSNPEPPYDGVNHLGIARIALATSDFDADVATLEAEGVEFLSEPIEMEFPAGTHTRFVCFKDPDGTVLAMVQPQRQRTSEPAGTN